MDTTERLAAVFEEELRSSLSRLRELSTQVSKEPARLEMARLAANLEGAARTVGRTDAAQRIRSLAASIERLDPKAPVPDAFREQLTALEGGTEAVRPRTDLERKLLEAFRIERGDHLAYLRAALEDAPAADVDEVYRRAHSLKGAARACGLEAVESVAHALESWMARVRDGQSRWTTEAVRVAQQALDAIEDVSDPEADGRACEEARHAVQSLLSGDSAKEEVHERVRAAFVVEKAEHLERIRATLEATLEEGSPGESELTDVFRRAHSLKGAATACGYADVAEAAHQLEDLFAALRDGDGLLDRFRVMALLDAIEDGESAPENPAGEAEAGDAAAACDAPARETGSSAPAASDRGPVETAMMRVSAERFDSVFDAASQLVTECLKKDARSRVFREMHRRASASQLAMESLRGLLAAYARRSPDPEIDRACRQLDALSVDVRWMARGTREAERGERRDSWMLRRLGNQLRDEVRSARMVPAANMFQGLRKMTRDLAQETGRQVDVLVSGLQVEADRMVLQALKDPILHMVRNALSHGIETPEERRRAGKSETGRIEVRLEVCGNQLVATVADDGRGFDRDAILREAVRSGRIADIEGDGLTDAEVFGLVFQSGFSTRQEVTRLSGRGMGLSVVQEALTRLQGEVEVQTPDVGTRLVLRAPLAISTYRMLLVRSAGQTFALPFSGVERLLRVEATSVSDVEGRPAVACGGEMLPVMSLSDLLGLESSASEDRVLSLVVLRSGGHRSAVAVDAVLGERDVLLENLDEPAAHLTHLVGAILLDDGLVSLVLQPSELVRAEGSSARRSVASGVAEEPTRAHRILVVDDSFTTRTLERSILETHGFDVSVAVDGREALDTLRVQAFDLVISDVEMPRLDGFGLVREIKAHERLKDTPVIVVSSLDRPEHRLRGLELGADAYIVKQRFDHEELLETIRQILG